MLFKKIKLDMNWPKLEFISLLKIPSVNPKKKDSFDANPEKDLICWDELPWSIESPNFINNKSLVAICWKGLLTYSVYHEEPQTELGFPHYALILYIWVNYYKGAPGFIFQPMDWDLPHPVRTAPYLPTRMHNADQSGPWNLDQSELQKFGDLIYIKQT